METHGRSPHTPLEPRHGTFNFSPSVVNRILSQDTKPSVLKMNLNTNSRRSFTPVHNRSSPQSKSPMISPIFKVPKNSPCFMPLPAAERQSNTLHPMAEQARANDETIFINLISPDVIIKVETPSPSPASTSRERTCSTGGQSVGVLMDSSFDAVVLRSMDTAPSAPVHIQPDHAHLNEHLTVLNVLDDIHMEHLGPIFEREEIDMNIFSIMSSSDLESIGIVGADQEAVLAAIKNFGE